MDRRQFLLTLAALALPAWATAGNPGPRLLSASWDEAEPLAGLVDGKGIALPGRGHGVIPIPGTTQAFVVSRRLGSWLARVDWQQGKLLRRIDAEFDRHFFGHAILSADGSTLLTTENDDATSQGLIGRYDARTLRRIDEIPTYGIGPHELLWLSPGKILAVANGGILTLPETGRTKLNRGRMLPSLVLLEWPSGRLLAEHVLDDKALSIRHLARSRDGTLAAALQAEYAEAGAHRDAPLLAFLRDGRLQLAEQPEGLMGYGASVAAVGNEFLVTAMRGNRLARWRSDGTPLPALIVPRPAGVASDGSQAWISSEQGGLYRYDPTFGTLDELPGLPGRRWDNHLVLAD
ncbi:DUF1513 domain-containing protein [Chitinilyticum litopenaei]|uniref:DUF1513 domain-containing protein n=1 Tax=Chitinilyticum litopenaei TaxID=1121276 RepID=UPI000400A3FA|nr:DUF1513 domain-containing protein [Chitinilyticum litopenaei]